MQKLDKFGVTYFKGLAGNVPYHLFHRPGQPIGIIVSFVAGARFDTKPGIAHFLEHMLLAGTKKYPNKRDLVTPLENLGGYIGGRTNTDLIQFNLELADKADLPIAFDVLNEVINNSLFDENTVVTERGSILAEIQITHHDRSRHVMRVYDHLVNQGTPCANNILGTEESVNSITKSDLISYYQKVLKESPFVWSFSGDLEEADIINGISMLHSSNTQINDIFSEKLPIIREETTSLEVFNDDKADLCLGFRTESADNIDSASLDLIMNYLVKGRGSKLSEGLRYKRGLIYGIGGYNFTGFDTGDWSIYTACSAKNVQEVLNVITDEIKSVRTNGIPMTEFDQVKSRINKGNAVSKQTAASWAGMAGNQAFLSMPEKFLITNYEKAISEVTPEMVITAANKYFTADNWYLAMCGPEILKDIKVNL